MQQDTAVVMAQDMEIESRIQTVRGIPVMLDRDLADLYQVELRAFNQAVRRNMNRFPANFMFEVDKDEIRPLITNCDLLEKMRYWPQKVMLFTEQGIAMLSAVLRSDLAVATSIRIMNAFVAMRRTLASMAPLLARLDAAERRQISDQAHNEERFKLLLDAMNADKFPPQKIFFKNTVEDAHSFIIKLVKKARESIVLVDGYVNDVSLDILAKKRTGVKVTLVTHSKTSIGAMDLDKFNEQYSSLTLVTSNSFHDRFLILDNAEIYQVGASIKDVGRLCFAVSQLEPMFIPFILNQAGLATAKA